MQTVPQVSPEPILETDHVRLMSLAVAGMALLVGIIGNLFFYQQGLGVNVGGYVLVCLLTASALLLWFEKPFTSPNLLFAIPALIFGGWFALRSAEPLLSLNALILLGALFLVARLGSEQRFLGGSWQRLLVATFETWVAEWAVAPLEVGAHSAMWLKNASSQNRQTILLQALVRGLIITLPIVLVFGVLLSSADAVFGDLMGDLFAWFRLDNFDSLIAQMMIIAFFTWLAVIGFKLLLLGPIRGAFDTLSEANILPQKGYLIGMIEAGMLLVSVDALFLLFVVIQGRYFFGGKSNITEAGYTYAEYARRGFFELLAVSIMTMCLVLLLAFITRREGRGEQLFQGLTVAMIIMTGVMLVSAFQRLSLYEEAYGYTRLRVLSHVFTAWLGVLFAVLLADILLKKRWFWYGVFAVGMCYVFTLNALNVDAFIARHNIERYESTGKVDVVYLNTLSYDAVPEMVKLLDKLEGSERENLLTGLGAWLYYLDDYHNDHTLLDYHWGKTRAWEALDVHRGALENYIKPRYSFY